MDLKKIFEDYGRLMVEREITENQIQDVRKQIQEAINAPKKEVEEVKE